MAAALMEPQDVRIVGWNEGVSGALEVAFLSGIAFGVVVVVLLTAATLAIITRRGS